MTEKRKRQLETSLNHVPRSARSNTTVGGKAIKKPGNLHHTAGSLTGVSAHSRKVVGTTNFEINEGDTDLQEFFDPLITASGINLNELHESIKVAPGDDTVNITGVKLWSALNSTYNWRNREAAAQAFLNYLEAGGAERFQKQDSIRLFQASCKVALICCYDKLL